MRQRFDAERWYWGATAERDGRPHIRPVLAVWMNDKVYSTTSPDARKGRNLQARPECSMAARAPAIDIVVEGTMSWVQTASAGASLRELMDRMGHSSPRAALISQHSTDERQRALAEAVARQAQATLDAGARGTYGARPAPAAGA